MGSLINDMLFLARADGGEQAQGKSLQRLAPLMASLLDYHEAAAAERNLTITVEGDLVLFVNPTLIQRAVSNLLSNACRYAWPGTVIQIKMELDAKGRQVISVINRGEQIPDTIIPRLFDRFFRTDTSRARDDLHAGLGLSIVEAIARMHGADVLALSGPDETEIGMAWPP